MELIINHKNKKIMATKKNLAKALRQLSSETSAVKLAEITRVQAFNGKRYILKVKKGFTAPMHLSNPYRRLKRAFKRNELTETQTASINQLALTLKK